jgi:hypothetical protein
MIQGKGVKSHGFRVNNKGFRGLGFRVLTAGFRKSISSLSDWGSEFGETD